MSVSSIYSTSLAESSDPLKPVGKKELDRNDFMTMFITQLQHQDPLKPMESFEMASQLAQFTNMEATLKMSENMEKLLSYQKSQNNLQLLALLGSEVEIDDNAVSVKGGKIGRASFDLPAGVEFCQVDIHDGSGRVVRSLSLGALDAGQHFLEWDGKNSLGYQVKDGGYSYYVTALDRFGDNVDVGYRSVDKVTGVRFENDVALLTVGDYSTIPISAVKGVVSETGSASARQEDQ